MWDSLSTTGKILSIIGLICALGIIGGALAILIIQAKKEKEDRNFTAVFWGLAMAVLGIIVLLMTLVAIVLLAGDSLHT